ncbi:MAG: SHOCT domain-containing protein [Clostridia bacterium]|nr:SHOCT domain-containing protein [Clostridia bacterium]
MSAKNNKKLILSGVLLIVSIVCYFLYYIPFFVHGNYWWILGHGFGSSFGNNIIIFVFTIIATIVLITYCFMFSKTKLSGIAYCISLGIFALLSGYLCISDIDRPLFILTQPLFLAVIVIMLIVKATRASNKGVFIVGTVFFSAYAATEIVYEMFNLIDWYPLIGNLLSNILFYTYLITRFIAFYNIWLAEGGSISFNKKITTVVKTSFEDNLVSLKQLFDSGTITEQEYNNKKNQILNKL